MNELGITLFWSSLPVTLLAGVAVVLTRHSSRQGPGAGAGVALMGLIGCLTLTGLALIPLPRISPLEIPELYNERLVEDPSLELPQGIAENEQGGNVMALLGHWRQLSHDVREDLTRTALQTSYGPAFLGWGVISGMALGIGRLLLGLWGVRCCLQQSRPVNDRRILEIAEDLKEVLGCPHRVTFRVAEEIGSPATVGWLSPVVLLPADWTTWSEDERRAILAHEMVHVARGDYLWSLLARLGAAIHFYHPLVRWLAKRLLFEQEVHADALGARWSGGRTAYLRTLARLALRTDARGRSLPTRPFLSAGETLMRRIAMLKAMDGPSNPRQGRWACGLIAALGTALLLAGHWLRDPEVAVASEQPRQTKQHDPVGARPPFELGFLPPHIQGAMGFRPADSFSLPGMEKYAALVNAELLDFSRKLSPTEPPLTLADIEQVVGILTLRTDKNADKHQSALMVGLNLVRTVRPINWRERLGLNRTSVQEIQVNGQSYYKIAWKDHPYLAALANTSTGESEVVCFFPDARTLVLDREDRIRRRLAGEASEAPSWSWAADWKTMERGLFTLALDTRNKSWLNDRRQPDSDLPPAFAATVQESTSLVLSGDHGEGFCLKAAILCPGAAEGDRVQNRVQEALTALRKQFEGTPKTDPQHGRRRLANLLLSGEWTSEKEHLGSQVRLGWRLQTKGSLSDFLESLIAASADE